MNKSHKNANLTDMLYYMAAEGRVPLSGTFELTPVCNFKCPMCYVRCSAESASPELIAWQDWLELAREAKRAGTLFLLLTGGEPLLYPDFFKLYNALFDMGFVITINSNGSLIDKGVIDEFLKRPPRRVNITLYGASSDTYGRLCANARGFDQVMNALKLLCQSGIEVKLNYSITPENCKDIKAATDIAKEYGVLIQFAGYMYKPTPRAHASGEDRVSYRLSPELAGKYRVYADYCAFDRETFLKIAESAGQFHPIDNCAFEPDVKDVGKEGSPVRCRAGRCAYWINYKGEATSCGLAEIGVAYPFKDGFSHAWKAIADFTDNVRYSPQCAACENSRACHPCLAMVYSETGELNRVPEYVCRMTRAALLEYERLAKSYE